MPKEVPAEKLAPKKPYVVEASDDGQRLDRLLMRLVPDVTFSAIQKACRTGEIRVNSGRVKGREKVKVGDILRLPPFMPIAPHFVEGLAREGVFLPPQKVQDFAENILYQDDDLLVVNKPAGVPSQAGSGHQVSMDRLAVAWAKGAFQPKLIHRLDKQTSGCLTFAKNRMAAAQMGENFKTREVQKTYLAVVGAALPAQAGKINLPLAKGQKAEENGRSREKIYVNSEGQSAVTHYRVLASSQNFHLVEASPETGRMHQIRVHLAASGAPIVGDGKYGYQGQSVAGGGLFLHAWKLELKNLQGKKIKLTADLPEAFEKMLKELDFKLNSR